MTQEYEPLSEAELVRIKDAAYDCGSGNEELWDAVSALSDAIATIRDLQGQLAELKARRTPTADEIRAQVQAMKKAVEDGTATEYDVILGEEPKEG